MLFSMVDRIVGFEKGRRLEALKTLSRAEEYLADHFPSFPVMPGVLMIEAMVQAAAWLLRLSDGFAHPVYILREVRAVRYSSFVRPGDVLRSEVTLTGGADDLFSFRGSGAVDGVRVVVGRFALVRRSLAALRPDLASVEASIGRALERQCASLMDFERGI